MKSQGITRVSGLLPPGTKNICPKMFTAIDPIGFGIFQFGPKWATNRQSHAAQKQGETAEVAVGDICIQ